MLNLVVHAKHQNLLDQFFKSLLPTIDERVLVWAVTEGLNLPENKRIIRIDRDEFRPGRYFNLILGELSGSDYMGVVNDDILFQKGWLEDVLKLLPIYSCVSPGFIETHDRNHFLKRVKATEELEGVEEGMHDAFYCFPVWLAKNVGGFDNDAVWWYDQSWYLTTVNAGHKWVTSRKVTIQHLVRGTLVPRELPRKEIQEEIMKKWGRKNQLKWKANSISLRSKFNV